VAFFVASTVPTLAGPPAGRGGEAVKDTKDDKSEATSDAKKSDAKRGDRKPAKKGDADNSGNANEHSNKGGELRGLDRADQVAGEHGAQGRAKARTKQEGYRSGTVAGCCSSRLTSSCAGLCATASHLVFP
jgi:hypothetical protein